MHDWTHTPDSTATGGRNTRRDFVKGVGTAALGVGIASVPMFEAAHAQTTATPVSEGFRFVFFPDPHLRDEYRSAEGIAAALQAAERLDPRPAFIWTGGDLCDDLRSLNVEQARARATRFVELWRQNTTIPAYHVLGNHDAAGWGDGDIPSDHPDFAFGLMQRLLGMERSYYSFDHGGWHFVIVDNIHRTEPGQHIGNVSDEQLTWLREDLRRHRERPTMVAMHVPPLTATEFLTDRAERVREENEWRIGFDRMIRNPDALMAALSEGNVRAVLSGHIHLVERLDLRGHTFLCLGSVSGQRWMGPRKGMGTAEGFGVVDVRADGTFDWDYQSFGWQASPEAMRAQG